MKSRIEEGFDDLLSLTNAGAQEHALLSAQPLTNGESDNGTKEASNGIDRRDSSLDLSPVNEIVKDEEVICHNDTTEHGLIITKQGHISRTGDGEPESEPSSGQPKEGLLSRYCCLLPHDGGLAVNRGGEVMMVAKDEQKKGGEGFFS